MAKSAPDPLDLEITAVIRAEESIQKLERGELAARAGIPERTLYTYLNDGREMKIWQIKALAKALGFERVTDLIALAEKRLEEA